MSRLRALKTWIQIGVLGLSILAMGCAKKESAPASQSSAATIPTDGTPYVPPYDGPGYGAGNTYGATAPLSITSLEVMNQYTARSMYDPKQIEVNLNLKKFGSSYGGTVRISYSDYGQRYEGFFTSGHSSSETKYNVWFTKNGKDVWHGFFEDYLGAIVVVIDGVVDLGDGAGKESKATGSIWFKNFGYTYAPHPPAYCWFVTLGPYDCRAWKTSKGVDTTRSVYPDNGYVKLGTFTDLDLEKAFNGGLD